MSTEKKVFQYLVLIVFAALTGYTFLLRATLYNEEGLPKEQVPVFARVISENLAGDYALFRMLERGDSPQKAYDSGEQSAFVAKAVHAGGDFASFAAPTKSFIFVPWISMPYGMFAETWIFWGVFFFGVALYSLFPLGQALLLMFALPAAYMSFSSGSWGLLMGAAVILSLVLAENRPKLSGFFTGLTMAEPLIFTIVFGLLIVRRQKKAAAVAGVFGLVILAASVWRYGGNAFAAALNAAWAQTAALPCGFLSVFSMSLCDGLPVWGAAFLQAAMVAGIIFYGARLFRRPLCPPEIQNAYAVAGAVLIMPFTQVGDYALLYAAFAFLLKDAENRGFLRGDIFWFVILFMSVFIDAYFLPAAGFSVQLFLAAVILYLSFRRSL